MSVQLRSLIFTFSMFFWPLIGSADELKIAVGLALPPYVLKTTDNGIELDIVREAMKLKGHTITAVYLPFARVSKTLESGKVDGAMTTNESSGIKDVFYTDSHITYQNVAIALKKNNFYPKSISELGNYSIIAFQDATKYLGNEYAVMAKVNKGYSEKSKQDKQITMLFAGRTDLVVMDINIFHYFKKLENQVDTSADVAIFEVFPLTAYKVALQKQKYVTDFNTGLAHLKSSGRYQEIIDSYVK